ncbi:MAG: peroxiredoxin family protein [Pseudomonadota bacterium]
MMKSTLLAASLLFAAPLAMAEQDAAAVEASIGPEIGAVAPEFSAVGSDGANVAFTDIAGEQGAVLVFSRSLDWCPFCKKQANELNSVAATMADAGWPISLITYDPAETLADYKSAEQIDYALLSDRDSAMIDAFGLRNLDVTAGSRFDGIPHPAIVFVSAEGTVVEMLREEGFRERPETELLPATVAALAGS